MVLTDLYLNATYGTIALVLLLPHTGTRVAVLLRDWQVLTKPCKTSELGTTSIRRTI